MNTFSVGMILLAVYLILVGLFALTNFQVVYAQVILGILAIVAGFCIILSQFRGGGP